MAKQIKIGLDKVPAPVTKQFTQLVDIEGTKLYDAAGNPLVTEEDAASGAFTSGQNALSCHVNNAKLEGGNVKVVEQFPETSDVSSSLLGIPRAEEQLSLFADVATYGLDEEQWSEYNYSANVNPYAWYNKKNPVYGRRSQPRFYEGSTEQALYLSQYPTQYNYPRGPVETRQATPSESFKFYMRFIALGKYLYTFFLNIDSAFAEKYFISDNIAYIVDRADAKVPIVWDPTGAFKGSGNFHDVKYANEDEQKCYDQIESWTYFFDLIKDKVATYPPMNTAITDFTKTSDYGELTNFATSQCVPGGKPFGDRFAILESKRSFRYQPGRASGFTFGTRMKADPNSTASVLEWGCSNDTDEYMFQLKGSVFSLIRRSTIRMPDELLLRQGLRVTDQAADPVYIKSIDNSVPLHETVIPRNKFNGDSLLGNGPSGYILSFEDVTMYKIEYSWYGAIGAKFYAYVPIGNGEARWILLHTFVIENGLGEPVLANPDFKFKYLNSCSNSSTMKSPQFIYKYGSSYYVDGGDEGTVRLATTTVEPKEFVTNTAVLGILPKNTILNGDGVPIGNNKKSYPTKASVVSTVPCRIDIEEIKGSPDGIHYNFSPSIVSSGDHPDTRQLDFEYLSDSVVSIKSITNPDLTGLTLENDAPTVGGDFSAYSTSIYRGDTLVIADVEYLVASRTDAVITLQSNYTGTGTTSGTATVLKKLNPADNEAKIIADGVYGGYVKYGSFTDNRSSNILRVRTEDYLLSEQVMTKSLKTDGIGYVDPKANDSFSAKLSGYYTIVASTTPIYANKFKVHWLNPISKDGTYSSKHWGDFGITFTHHLPTAPNSLNANPEKISFLDTDGAEDVNKEFDITEYPMVEFRPIGVSFDNIKRAESYEWDPSFGVFLDTDPRLNSDPVKWSGYPNTTNSSQAGRVQAISAEIGFNEYEIASVDGTFVTVDTGFTNSTYWKVTFAPGVTGPSDASVGLDGSAEVGSNFIGTGKFFATTVFRKPLLSNYFYVLKGNGSTGQELNIDLAATNKIQVKTLTISDDWKVNAKEENGEDKFDAKKFTKIKIIPFGAQPLYPVFALKNGAVINSITVEEIGSDGTVKTHNPVFVTETTESNPNISIQNYGADPALTPCAFNEEGRLDSSRYDISTLQPLRPGTNISTFFVGANDPTEFDLDNIFSTDRRGVSRGLLNDKAIYFKATSLTGEPGEVQMTLTAKEQ